MKYKKKPVVVEAFQYDGDLKGADGKYYVPDWAAEAYEKGIMYYDLTELFINTLEGTHHVSVGDYIIQWVKGELYPCKQDIFVKTYDVLIGDKPETNSISRVLEKLHEIADNGSDMILVADEPEYYDGYEDGALKAIEIIKEEFGLN